MPFWNCCYHVVWATKYRRSVITPPIETVTISAIQAKSDELHCPILAINAVTDHIHVAVKITPSIAAASWVGHAKGLSAHAVNAAFDHLETPFKWQEGYGLVTFSEKYAHFVVDYVTRQKEHHAGKQLVEALEHIEE